MTDSSAWGVSVLVLLGGVLLLVAVLVVALRR